MNMAEGNIKETGRETLPQRGKVNQGNPRLYKILGFDFMHDARKQSCQTCAGLYFVVYDFAFHVYFLTLLLEWFIF